MWDRQEHKLALLELISSGRLRQRSSQIAAWEWLAQLSWTRTSGRRNEIILDEDRGHEGKRLLNQIWPNWQQTVEAMQSAGLPISERGWRQLQDIERKRNVVDLPPHLERLALFASSPDNVYEHSRRITDGLITGHSQTHHRGMAGRTKYTTTRSTLCCQ
jgi:hypothetical protein